MRLTVASNEMEKSVNARAEMTCQNRVWCGWSMMSFAASHAQRGRGYTLHLVQLNVYSVGFGKSWSTHKEGKLAEAQVVCRHEDIAK